MDWYRIRQSVREAMVVILAGILLTVFLIAAHYVGQGNVRSNLEFERSSVVTEMGK